MSAGAKRGKIPLSRYPLNDWPSPDVNVLPETKRELFQRRQKAVLMYAEGLPFKEITRASGISEQETRRHVGRCVMPTVDGSIVGFYALIPGWRIKAYNRTARIAHTAGGGSGGCSGALTQLFETFPEVRDYIRGRFLQLPGTRKLKTTRISYVDLHGEFLDELRARHIGENDWPFNTDDCGYQSLRRYCHSLLDSDQHLYIKARSGIEAQRRGRIGTGEHSIFPRMHGFGCCQLDFHKIDALCTILLENEEGVMIPILLPRFHVGVLIEERWGLVIGAFIALEMTPSGDSVLEVIDCALRPFPIAPSESRTQLVDLAGVFPNQMLPLLQYQCFSVLKMDNAWSNAAGDVVTNIIDTIGCAINFGPVKQWWRRGLVESVFDALSACGMKRLPSTVGAHPKDTSKDEPEKNAVRFKIAVHDIIAVIHGCIRDHNETRSEKCGFASPLEACMASMENPDSGMMFQPVPQPRKDDLRLMRRMIVVTVRGNAGKHERPHVRLGRWRYTNAELSHRYDLVGEKLLAYVDRRDRRIATASVQATGEDLGLLEPPASHMGTCISWWQQELIHKGGLSAKKHENTTSATGHWERGKHASILKGNSKQGQRKKKSKDALDLTKAMTEQQRTGRQPVIPASTPQVGQETPTVLAATYSNGGRFGLNALPSQKPITRGD